MVKLDTNGRDYQIVKRMIQDKILDYVAVDLKHSLHSYEEAIGLPQPAEFYHSYQKLLQVLLESNIEYEYRTTVAKGLHTADDIENMFNRGVHLWTRDIEEFENGTNYQLGLWEDTNV